MRPLPKKGTTNEGNRLLADIYWTMVPATSVYFTKTGDLDVNKKFLSGDKQPRRYGKTAFTEKGISLRHNTFLRLYYP